MNSEVIHAIFDAIKQIFIRIVKYGIPWLILLAILACLLPILIKYPKIKKSTYLNVRGNTLLQTIFSKGTYGEFLTYNCLEKRAEHHQLLTNIYLPIENGETAEIDLLFINSNGIFTLESKNYSGWIFGNEKQKEWTQSLNKSTKNKFYNPIWQNSAHIKALKKLLPDINNILYFSLIVFSERCELKKVTTFSENVRVFKRNNLSNIIEEIMQINGSTFTDSQIDDIYNTIVPYTKVDNQTKAQHIEEIKQKNS